jgi:hypothetical protein
MKIPKFELDIANMISEMAESANKSGEMLAIKGIIEGAIGIRNGKERIFTPYQQQENISLQKKSINVKDIQRDVFAGIKDGKTIEERREEVNEKS